MKPRTIVWFLAAAALWGAGGDVRAERILYYVEDGEVVFTNTPSRKDVKPAFKRDPRKVYAGANLPRTPYDAYIDQVAHENGLDPTLIKAVALVESGFNPKAVSNKGAKGIMQFIPSTAKRYGVSDLHDPHQSLRAGAMHLRDLLDEFDGDLTLALAAYNAGSGAVKRYGGVPAYAETQDYVRKVKAKLGKGGRRNVVKPATVAGTKITLRREPDGSITLAN